MKRKKGNYLMKKRVQMVITMLMAFFVLPLSAYAAPGDSADKTNPFTELKKYIYMRWDLLTGLDFVLIIIGIVISAIVLYILYKLILDIFVWVAKVRSAKASYKDKKFLVEIGITVLILFLFFSGTMFDWLGDAYDWMGNQKLDEKVTATTK